MYISRKKIIKIISVFLIAILVAVPERTIYTKKFITKHKHFRTKTNHIFKKEKYEP